MTPEPRDVIECARRWAKAFELAAIGLGVLQPHKVDRTWARAASRCAQQGWIPAARGFADTRLCPKSLESATVSNGLR